MAWADCAWIPTVGGDSGAKLLSDWSRGTGSTLWKGALMGGLGGFATGYLLSSLVGVAQAVGGGDVNINRTAIVGGSVVGAVGALLGGLNGATVPKWHKVYQRP